jgi:hypothetical protein
MDIISLSFCLVIVAGIRFTLAVASNSWLWWKHSRAHIMGVRAVRLELAK